MRAILIISTVLLAGCATTEQGPPGLTLDDAKAIVVSSRAVYWKDPESIRDAAIGQPYSCTGGLVHVARPPSACVCVMANAKNLFGGYTGLKPSVVLIAGGSVIDVISPRSQDECKRRSNNPSLNRPGFRSRRSKNPAADSLFALSRQRAGDEERGRLFEGSACGSH